MLLAIVTTLYAVSFGQNDDYCRNRMHPNFTTIPFFEARPELVQHTHDQWPSKEIKEVTDGIYVAIGYDLANTMIIETDTGIIIIDTLSDTTAAKNIYNDYKDLRTSTQDVLVEAIILTHYHLDHYQGIGFWLNINMINGFSTMPPPVYVNSNFPQTAQNFFVWANRAIAPRSLEMFGMYMKWHMDQDIVMEKNLFINCGIGPFLNNADNASMVDPYTFNLISDDIPDISQTQKQVSYNVQ
eukprot:250225_1